MSADRETTRIVRSWLQDGVTRLPDTILDAVLDELPSTHQRRVTWWPAWRLSHMNTSSKLALGAVAALLVAIIGFAVANNGNIGSDPPIDPVVSPSAQPSVEAQLLPVGASTIPPGVYRVSDPLYTPVTADFTVPEGWVATDSGAMNKSADTTSELGFALFGVTHVYGDACQSAGTLTEVGPSPDELVAALVAQENLALSGPTEMAIGGYPAQRLDIGYPAELDTSTCRHPGLLIQVWADEAEQNFFAVSTGHAASVYVVDVDGERVIVTTDQGPDASDDDLAQLDEIVRSMRFP